MKEGWFIKVPLCFTKDAKEKTLWANIFVQMPPSMPQFLVAFVFFLINKIHKGKLTADFFGWPPVFWWTNFGFNVINKKVNYNITYHY